MPIPNFLKKKRTREEKPDHSSSQPASPVTPVTPSASKPFESTLVKSPTQTTQGSTASTSATSHSRRSTKSFKETPASAGGGPQMNHSVVQHQQVPYGLQHTPSPGQAGTPHNLPSINNLINIPQNDGEQGERRVHPVPQLICMKVAKADRKLQLSRKRKRQKPESQRENTR